MLEKLVLENFRSYISHSFGFQKTNILIGKNGIGKTNLLEAVYLIATGRSWRTIKDIETINWNAELCKIKVEIKNDGRKEIEMIIQKNPSPKFPKQKIVKINSVGKNLTDLLGLQPVVLFSPEEIQIIDGSPALRRRMLDVILCQTDRRYTRSLLELMKVIRERNKLLYFIKIGKSKVDELVFWDQKLLELGTYIIKKRIKAVDQFNKDLTKTYQTVSGTKETLEFKYCPSVLPEEFSERIERERQREIEASSTLFGPHRDDAVFLLESKNIRTFGSRGEYRSAVLALKIAELNYVSEATKVAPVLLLDDIFSELDFERRLHLAKIVEKYQTIVTTTDFDHIEKGLKAKAKVVELR